MNQYVLLAIDLVLALGATLRLTRLVVTDDLGQWWIKDPLDRWFHAKPGKTRRMKFHRYLEGLECPYCVSFWAAVLVVGSWFIISVAGADMAWWRLATIALTISWAAGHIGVRMGDAGYADGDE